MTKILMQLAVCFIIYNLAIDVGFWFEEHGGRGYLFWYPITIFIAGMLFSNFYTRMNKDKEGIR